MSNTNIISTSALDVLKAVRDTLREQNAIIEAYFEKAEREKKEQEKKDIHFVLEFIEEQGLTEDDFPCVVNIGFRDYSYENGRRDETQKDPVDMADLAYLWLEFCDENKLLPWDIRYIRIAEEVD